MPGRGVKASAELKAARQACGVFYTKHPWPFWHGVQMVSKFLAPNRQFAAHLDSRLRQLARPCLAVHMRYGDACFELVSARVLNSSFRFDESRTKKARDCGPVSEYANATAELVYRYRFKSVVMTTDSERALHELSKNLQQRASRPNNPLRGVQLFSSGASTIGDKQDRLRHVFEQRSQFLNQPWKLFLDFLVDIHAMARCDGFVGKFTSNVARLAFALLAARRGCLAPYVSIDRSPFCLFGKGRSALGEFHC